MNKLMCMLAVATIFTGCASVPTANPQLSAAAKQFNAPAQDKAGLYIYRAGSFGGAVKKDIKINGNCIGETAPNVFFFEEVAGNNEYVISTESEFSPNELKLFAQSGQNYFIQQYIKPGVLVAGANLKQVNAQEGQQAVQKLQMAEKGKCGQ